MASARQIIKSAFQSADDATDTNKGIRPVIFDILSPDYETSILPENFRLVLHVNPQTMTLSYNKIVERIQTRGGFVEQHWGEGVRTIDFTGATGGFIRLYTGTSNITGGPYAKDMGGTRRETIAYDKYLDLLALFCNNGSVFDSTGQIVFQGIIQITFDGGIYQGWFNSLSITEDAAKPFMFEFNANFLVEREIQRFHDGGF